MKLVVHIGHGKTGSSSIQKTLLQNKAELARQGVKYLGLMLEHSENISKKNWQVISGSDLFFDRSSVEEANAELLEVLTEEVSSLQAGGVNLAIWSNEWLATRGRHALPALETLKLRGVDIEIQCYVRRHDKWIQSAYVQWGLKHKSYEGPLRDFRNWLSVFGQRDVQFGPSLKVWDSVFGEKLKVSNYDASGDVVRHFLTVNGIRNVEAINENIAPNPLILAAQAVYNGRAKRRLPSTAFNVIGRLASRSDENKSTLPPLDRLTPSVEQLQELVASRAGDIAEVNRFLLRSGEPPLSFDAPVKQAPHPTPWEMDQLILKLVYSLAEEAAQLRAQVVALQAKLNVQNDDKVP